MELSKDELKEAVSAAIAPLATTVDLKFQFLGEKVDEVRAAQGQMYTREMVDTKLADVHKEVAELKASFKNLWPQALAVGGGLWLVLQLITWVAANAPK